MPKKKEKSIILYGRPNVGKSTLFNCLIERQQALVSDTPGTTRDHNEAKMEWRGLPFRLVDTAGVIDEKILRSYLKRDEFDVEKQVQAGLKRLTKEAAAIVFVVDSHDGLLAEDRQMARALMRVEGKEVILVANKADNPRRRKDAADFIRLGLGEPLPVSASSGSGTGDLLDRIYDVLGGKGKKMESTEETDETEDTDCVRVSILGKPNAGKSSLINKLCGQNIQIVSHVPHTTREPKDIEISWKEKRIRLIDTAGMHKRGLKSVKNQKEREALERLSIGRSLATLQRAQVALLVLDINEEITQQDQKIAEAIMANRCSLIIVANKWDRVEKRDTKKFTEYIYGNFPFATWAPIQFTSALTGEKLDHLKDLITEIAADRQILLSDNAMSRFLASMIRHHRPVKAKGIKKPYVHCFKQTKADPPKFCLTIGARDTVHESYVRFLENQLRLKFGFRGAPLSIYVEKNRPVHGKNDNNSKPKKQSHED